MKLKQQRAQYFHGLLYDETLAHEYNEDNNDQRRAMEDPGTTSAPKFGELKEVIKIIRNGNAPDNDIIRPRMSAKSRSQTPA